MVILTFILGLNKPPASFCVCRGHVGLVGIMKNPSCTLFLKMVQKKKCDHFPVVQECLKIVENEMSSNWHFSTNFLALLSFPNYS